MDTPDNKSVYIILISQILPTYCFSNASVTLQQRTVHPCVALLLNYKLRPRLGSFLHDSGAPVLSTEQLTEYSRDRV